MRRPHRPEATQTVCARQSRVTLEHRLLDQLGAVARDRFASGLGRSDRTLRGQRGLTLRPPDRGEQSRRGSQDRLRLSNLRKRRFGRGSTGDANGPLIDFARDLTSSGGNDYGKGCSDGG